MNMIIGGDTWAFIALATRKSAFWRRRIEKSQVDCHHPGHEWLLLETLKASSMVLFGAWSCGGYTRRLEKCWGCLEVFCLVWMLADGNLIVRSLEYNGLIP